MYRTDGFLHFPQHSHAFNASTVFLTHYGAIPIENAAVFPCLRKSVKRDSIRSKVFEDGGVGFGEGRKGPS
ncbi:hypothetical protein, partial [Bilophila wadsworthia]|uniref:hypothetical protein n=1 Tax=Bilophila wadsworthia TaxID=35833 RepID=UPI0032610197